MLQVTALTVKLRLEFHSGAARFSIILLTDGHFRYGTGPKCNSLARATPLQDEHWTSSCCIILPTDRQTNVCESITSGGVITFMHKVHTVVEKTRKVIEFENSNIQAWVYVVQFYFVSNTKLVINCSLIMKQMYLPIHHMYDDLLQNVGPWKSALKSWKSPGNVWLPEIWCGKFSPAVAVVALLYFVGFPLNDNAGFTFFSFVRALSQQRTSQCSVCHHPCPACFLGLSYVWFEEKASWASKV